MEALPRVPESRKHLQRRDHPQACKEAEITVRTLYHWRKKCGGLKMDKATRLKELELALDKQILQDMTVLVPYPINRHVINLCCSVR